MKIQGLLACLRPEMRDRLGTEQIRAVNRIDSEDFSLIGRKLVRELARRSEKVDEAYVDKAIFALKQYYVLGLLNPKNAHAISLRVDDVWHLHILDTEGYATFCDEVMGRLMNHIHLDHDDPRQMANIQTLYLYTLDILSQMFVYVDEHFWPRDIRPESMVCKHDADARRNRFSLFESEERGQAYAFASA